MTKRQREANLPEPLTKFHKGEPNISSQRNLICTARKDYNNYLYFVIDENGKLVYYTLSDNPWQRTIFDFHNPFSDFTENIWKNLIKYLDFKSIFAVKNTCSLLKLIIIGLLGNVNNHKEMNIDLSINEGENIYLRKIEQYCCRKPSRYNVQFVSFGIDVTVVSIYSAVKGILALDDQGNLWHIEIKYSPLNLTIKRMIENVASIDVEVHSKSFIIRKESGEFYLYGYWLIDEYNYFKQAYFDKIQSPYIIYDKFFVIFYDNNGNFQKFGDEGDFLTNFITEKKDYLPIQSYASMYEYNEIDDYGYHKYCLLLDCSYSLWYYEKKGKWQNIKFDSPIYSVVSLSRFDYLFLLSHCGKLWIFEVYRDSYQILCSAQDVHTIFSDSSVILSITMEGSLLKYKRSFHLVYEFPFLKALTNFPASIAKSARK